MAIGHFLNNKSPFAIHQSKIFLLKQDAAFIGSFRKPGNQDHD